VKDADLGMKSDTELLDQLNKELVPEDLTEQDKGTAAGLFASVHDVAAPAENNAATGWSHDNNDNNNKTSVLLPRTPPCRGPAPETDPHERCAHNWREPKAKRLEKKERKICWLCLIWCCIPQGTGRGSFTRSSSVVRGLGQGGAMKSVVVQSVSQRCCSASVSALLTVGVTRHTQVSSSWPHGITQSWMGSLKICLSEARSKSCLAHRVVILGRGFLSLLRSFSSPLRP
jgi:hypothetical protein